jgi:Tol biopolymer transport system component
VAAVVLLGTLFFASGPTAIAADDVEDFQEAIFVGDSDGSNLKRLADFDGYTSQGSPCWSSDGQFIAFDASKPQLGQRQFFDGHIIVVKADGTNPRDLGPGMLPSLSPKGNRVAYCRHQQMGAPGVYMMELSDPNTPALIDDKGWGAEWSPDGTRLAYTRGRNLRLYDLIEGTFTSILDDEQAGIASIRWNFCWSPDSRRIAFVADTTDGRHVVAIANADGEKQKAEIVYEGNMGPAVAWRPLKNEIVFETTTDDRQGFQSLFAVKVEAPGVPVRMAVKPVDRRLRNPAFSPDGKRLAVSVFARLPGDD